MSEMVLLVRTVQPKYTVFCHPTQGVVITKNKDHATVAFLPSTRFKFKHFPEGWPITPSVVIDVVIDYRMQALVSPDGCQFPITDEGVEIFREEEAYKEEVTDVRELTEWEYIDVYGH